MSNGLRHVMRCEKDVVGQNALFNVINYYEKKIVLSPFQARSQIAKSGY
jgi:hypothetical protein